jgi:hypothetical protein
MRSAVAYEGFGAPYYEDLSGSWSLPGWLVGMKKKTGGSDSAGLSLLLQRGY